jgi:hypothetical protein
MAKRVRISRQTQTNWLIDAGLFLGAIVASLSGIYFLFFTSGGYQRGRNSLYGVTFLFSRDAWSDIHTWSSVIMIIAAMLHVVIHWGWVKRMAWRYVNVLRGRGSTSSRGAKVNVLVNLAVALAFVVTALSGIYFLFFIDGGYQGGQNMAWDPAILVSRVTWDLIHTWAGVIMIAAAIVHLAIHWRWVVNVTRRFFMALGQSARVVTQV